MGYSFLESETTYLFTEGCFIWDYVFDINIKATCKMRKIIHHEYWMGSDGLVTVYRKQRLELIYLENLAELKKY
jgi:hypothetical protein